MPSLPVLIDYHNIGTGIKGLSQILKYIWLSITVVISYYLEADLREAVLLDVEADLREAVD